MAKSEAAKHERFSNTAEMFLAFRVERNLV